MLLSAKEPSLYAFGTALIAVSDTDIIVGNIIIDKTIITASKLCPFGKLNIFCILGTITANPNIPYNTDGIPANNSTAGDIIFATFFGATSAINTAVNIPIGTPIIRLLLYQLLMLQSSVIYQIYQFLETNRFQ